MVTLLIEVMVTQVERGKRADTGFKEEAYHAVLEKVNEMNTREVKIDLDRAKNKISEYKTLYVLWKQLKDLSG